MARIRSIKPSIWSDRRFAELSLQARLLCLGMISNSDDDGRIIASGASLIGAVFPHDDIAPKTVEKWRDEIATAGIIRVYTEGRGTYAHFPKWERHQIIRKRQKSTLPDPPECGTECSTSDVPGTSPDATPKPNPLHHGSRARNGGGDGTSYLEAETEAETDIASRTTRSAPARPPDEIWDALMDACGVNTDAGLTKDARGAYNAAAKQLRDVGATPQDIRRRAAIYRGQWPAVSLTPTALARRWSECERPPTPATPRPDATTVALNNARARAQAAEATQHQKALP